MELSMEVEKKTYVKKSQHVKYNTDSNKSLERTTYLNTVYFNYLTEIMYRILDKM